MDEIMTLPLNSNKPRSIRRGTKQTAVAWYKLDVKRDSNGAAINEERRRIRKFCLKNGITRKRFRALQKQGRRFEREQLNLADPVQVKQ